MALDARHALTDFRDLHLDVFLTVDPMTLVPIFIGP